MKHTPTVTCGIEDGVKITRLDDWTDFSDFITDRLNYRGYIWRGQQDISWALEPSLERSIASNDAVQTAAIRKAHLKRFQYASRGRRGANPFPPQNENEWWGISAGSVLES